MAKSQVLIELQLIQKGGKISIAAKDLKNVDQQTKNVDKSTKAPENNGYIDISDDKNTENL